MSTGEARPAARGPLACPLRLPLLAHLWHGLGSELPSLLRLMVPAAAEHVDGLGWHVRASAGRQSTRPGC